MKKLTATATALALAVGFFASSAHAGTLFTTTFSSSYFGNAATYAVVIYPDCDYVGRAGKSVSYSVGTTGDGSTDIANHLGSQPCDSTDHSPVLLGTDGHGDGFNLAPGNYYLTLYKNTADGGAELGYYYVPILGGDSDYSTHVLAITKPSLYATTTSPATITFSAYEASSTVPNGFELTFVNSLTYESHTVRGYLADASPYPTGFVNDGVYSYSTTSPALGSGTWKITATLLDINSEAPDSPYRSIGSSATSWFGINYNDNVQTVSFSGATAQYASSSCAISFSGSFSLSDCLGYIFIPGANVFSAYTSLPNVLGSKFPFSYLNSIKATWNGLSASSTANAPTYQYELHDLGIGSTTPLGNILPNATVFSASTTEQYFPAGTFNLLKSLAAIAIWLTFFADVFFTTRNLIRV